MRFVSVYVLRCLSAAAQSVNHPDDMRKNIDDIRELLSKNTTRTHTRRKTGRHEENCDWGGGGGGGERYDCASCSLVGGWWVMGLRGVVGIFGAGQVDWLL